MILYLLSQILVSACGLQLETCLGTYSHLIVPRRSAFYSPALSRSSYWFLIIGWPHRNSAIDRMFRLDDSSEIMTLVLGLGHRVVKYRRINEHEPYRILMWLGVSLFVACRNLRDYPTSIVGDLLGIRMVIEGIFNIEFLDKRMHFSVLCVSITMAIA